MQHSALVHAKAFGSLGPEARAEYESIGISSVVPRGIKLFRENASNHGVFVVYSGQVKLSCTSREGRILILKMAKPGDILGLSAVISNSKYEVTAETFHRVEIKNYSGSSISLFPPNPWRGQLACCKDALHRL